ncbi:MAG: right-handed parallel beta-helix repeat-containing protein [Flavobacteriales bacterium]
MRTSFLAISILTACSLYATDYYVSPTGNDNSNGTSTGTAWKTITRVNNSAFSYQPGDRILFQRGGTWRGEVIMGTSGTGAQNITIGAYGSGAKPLIKGSELMSGWSQYSGNIWRTSVAGPVDQVYVAGQMMTMARYPNSGWLRNSQGGGTQIQSNDLTQPNGYWNGGLAVVRSSSSSFDTLTISNYSNHTIYFPHPTLNLGNEPWGFYITNKLSELDSPGEWFFDRVAHQLYLWAPNGSSPNGQQVEAAVYRAGINCYWHRSYLRVENLAFQHQRLAGVFNDGADFVTATGCDFSHLYHGIRSVGFNNTYTNNTFNHTYATGAFVIDGNTLVADNQFTNIALLDGQGESTWGYFGIRAIGQGNIVRSNRLDSIGYIGIIAENNTLVEKNVVRHPLATMNDGGGIAIDHADGLIIQDNIVSDPIGSYENGAATNAPHNEHMGIGIYFGNTLIKNSKALRNTVYNCPQTGIHVDHTMLTTGLQIKDNILFNNGVQITISDYSNATGTGATPPYYIPNYNDVYSGNIMYCLTKDQLCMLQYNTHGVNPVDFGTYTNNHYFNPYNELSIKVISFVSGDPRFFSLERWQFEKGEDAGSTRSPLRLAPFATVQELGAQLVINGTFTSNVTGWTGWPNNAQVTRVTNRLDNGALKAYLPDNSQYPSFTLHNPDLFQMQNQQWYRLRISLQSDGIGDLLPAVKAQSQFTGPETMWQWRVPFDGERRDLEMYFQANLSDQAQVQFENLWTDPQYYLDNVAIQRVTVQALDPAERHKIYANDQATAQSFSLPSGCWSGIDGILFNGSVTVPPYSSVIAYSVEGSGCNVVPESGIKVKMALGGAMDNSTGIMRDDLRANGHLPDGEPYSALGYTLENAGATIAPSVKQVTGNLAVVDWVVLELRPNASSSTVTASRAALLRRDGSVVDPVGNVLLTFTAPVAGKFLSVRHRNHLGVLCTTVLAGNGEVTDFTLPGTPTYGTDAERYTNGSLALWPGNVNLDRKVKYTGVNNDRDGILAVSGGLVPTSIATGYLAEDVNLDGVVSYTGANNDRDAVLVAVGGTQATATRSEQLP